MSGAAQVPSGNAVTQCRCESGADRVQVERGCADQNRFVIQQTNRRTTVVEQMATKVTRQKP